MSGLAALAGLRVAVLRPPAQEDALASALVSDGATVHSCPIIRIEPSGDAARLRHVVGTLEAYDMVVFTSANAVRMLAAQMPAADAAPAPPAAAVGPATAVAARAAGFHVALQPDRHTGADLAGAVAQWLSTERTGRRVLFPRARDARPTLPDGLRAHGVVVDEIECYRTAQDSDGALRLRGLLRSRACDVLAFTSPSQVAAFAARVGIEAASGVTVAVIGPTTAGAAVAAGLDVQVIAQPHSIDGFVDALRRHVRRRTDPSDPRDTSKAAG